MAVNKRNFENNDNLEGKVQEIFAELPSDCELVDNECDSDRDKVQVDEPDRPIEGI
jgi:hypothetical protein